ncbi:hypothetical protein D3C85_1664120 [compost metagenome]
MHLDYGLLRLFERMSGSFAYDSQAGWIDYVAIHAVGRLVNELKDGAFVVGGEHFHLNTKLLA